MDRDATAMMGALARSLAAATADPPAYFSQLTACMRGPCQQEVSKCRQGRRAPCLPATAKKGARAACEELRVQVLLRETARCNTNQKIAVGVKREIAKRAEAQGLADNETSRAAIRDAELSMLRDMSAQCATAATANDPQYVECMASRQAEAMAMCAAKHCDQAVQRCTQQKCPVR